MLDIGGGISGRCWAELSELRPTLSICVIEAGRGFFDIGKTLELPEAPPGIHRKPWPGDADSELSAEGAIRDPWLGWVGTHWGGIATRFPRKTALKSTSGLAVDWPLEWRNSKRYCCEDERGCV